MMRTSNQTTEDIMTTISELIRTEAAKAGITTEKPNGKYAKQILEAWLDSNDPTAEYYVTNIPNLNRAVSFQRFNDKDYVCVLALLGGRLAAEPFLIPRDFWEQREREINPSPRVQDGYPDFEI